MADVLIDHCVVRLVRRSGWSWGPDPKVLVDAILRALPSLLNAQLSSMFENSEDRVYEAPVTLRIPIRAKDLSDELDTVHAETISSAAISSRKFSTILEAALRSALSIPEPVTAVTSDPAGRSASRFEPVASPVNVPAAGADAIEQYLFARQEANELSELLAAFTLEELEAWHGAIICAASTRELPGLAIAAVEAAISELRSEFWPPAHADRTARLRYHLLLSAHLAKKLRSPLRDPAIWKTLDAMFPASPQDLTTAQASALETLPSENTEVRSEALSGSSGTITGIPPAIAFPPRASPAIAAPGQWTTRIKSALPFLLAGPLVRTGYFDVLAAVLEAARLSAESPHFAAALAYKVLAPSERGWRRPDEIRHAAATFAGSPDAIPDEALSGFTRRILPQCGVLDRQVEQTIIKGRDPATPVTVSRADLPKNPGYLVIDTHGCFPIARCQDALGLVHVLKQLSFSAVLVTLDASVPGLLQQLEKERFKLITAALPLAHEARSRILRGTTRLGWTNHPEPAAPSIVRAAAMLDDSSRESLEMWEELGVRRIAVPRAAGTRFEQSLTLAASLGLGVLAFELWNHRGRTSPQMALERLGDLEGRARFTPHTVNVGLPLGRRRSELDEKGLLRSVRNVPWLGGRTLEFSWA